MRRTCNNIKNTDFFNRLRNNISTHNSVAPDFFNNQLWVAEDTNGVQIIELSSSDSSNESVENENYNKYLNTEKEEETREKEVSNYRITDATRVRQMKNERSSTANDYEEEPSHLTFASKFPNKQRNCFTLIKNQNYSDSSSENYEGIDIIEVDDDDDYWDHVYNEKVFDKAENRTVLIYAYKKNRELAENDFDLVNINSKDTSTSTSDDEEEKNKRLGSPIPTYIPRLDLSVAQTLSTVTEISEQKSDRSEKLHNIKSKNNWFSDKKSKDKNNVLKWMALSPRERRRNFTNTTDVIDLTNKKADTTYLKEDKFDDNSARDNKTKSRGVQVEVDVHENELESKLKTYSIRDIVTIDITFEDTDKENSEESYDLDSKIHCVEIDGKVIKAKTESIEKFDPNNWIDEKIDEVHSDGEILSDDTVKSNSQSDRTSQRFRVKKSPQCIEYLPPKCSPASLHLSLSMPSGGPKTWFERFIHCFKCCK